jgi:hypothetical protein
VFFRINEIRDLINTWADHRSRVNYVTLALSGRSANVVLPRLCSG